MNPEEGELRPQLLDRFGLNVALGGHTAPTERGQIIRRRLDFDSDPQGFCAEWESVQASLRERCQHARNALASIPLDDQALARITERCFAAGVDGLRADLVWLRAARAHAAWRGANAIAEEDIDAVAEFALRHRRREHSPPAPAQSQTAKQTAPQNDNPGEGQGQWGELPAQALATGARREVPSWPKKP
ncbi:cobaltochelatase subunit [compost metagenome]